MSEQITLVPIFLGSFLLALGVSYFLVKRRRVLFVPVANAPLRVRSEGHLYRCRFVSADASAWRFTAPLQRDNYVAMMVGEMLTVEAMCPGGVLLFRASVVGRDAATHEVLISPPSQVGRLERRQAPRSLAFEGVRISVDGYRAEILDLSSRGARISSSGRFAVGTRVLVELPWTEEPVGAWVLACEPRTRALDSGSILRVVFEVETVVPSDKKKTAFTMR